MNNKSKEELIEIIEQLDEKIEELEQEVYEASELEDEVSELQGQLDDVNSALTDREEVSEKAFYSGYKSGANSEFVLKSWLNFKIEERI